jgi:TRAP-type C4-dicarboxylate transport system permease small subunit
VTADVDPEIRAPQAPPRIPLKIEEVVVAAAMAAMALITAANVATRYLSNISFSFTEEFSVVLMVLMTLLGTSLAMASGNHIRIGYFVDLLSARGRRIAEIISMVLVVICFGIIFWYGAWLTWDEYRFGDLSSGLGYPQWLYTGWLPLLSLAVIGRAIGRAVRMWRGANP